MWVQKCDLCGEEKKTEKFRYKVKVEKEYFCWEDHGWEKVGLCEDCQRRIADFIRGCKEDDRIRKEKTNVKEI